MRQSRLTRPRSPKSKRSKTAYRPATLVCEVQGIKGPVAHPLRDYS
jgi:hypothetical protein